MQEVGKGMKARSYNIKEKLAGSKRVATACMRALRQRAMIRSVLCNISQSDIPDRGGGRIRSIWTAAPLIQVSGNGRAGL
jgi:hypothetical protein